MEKNPLLPSQSNAFPSTENYVTGVGKSNTAFSSNSGDAGHSVYRAYYRSKSLSSFSPDAYSRNDVKSITERLNRIKPNVKPSAIKHFSRRQKMTLASLALVDFMSFCSMSVMAPFFPKEAELKGLSETLSGFIFSFYALVMFTTSPIFGKLLPKLGAKFLFLIGILVAGICNILFGMLEYIEDYTLFTTFCIIVRGFEALGGSAFSTASYVYVINLFPDNIGSVIGILETFVGLGMSTGPALGGILYSLGGFSMPFIVLGIAMLVVAPINIWLLPDVEDCNDMDQKSTSMFKLLKVPAVLVTGSVVVIVSSTWSFLDPTLEPHLRQFDLGPEQIGLIFLLTSALYGISSPVWGWLADKVDNHWSMMVAGLFLSTIGLLLLGPSPIVPFIPSSLWLIMVSLSILGVSVALSLMPTFKGLLTSAINGGCGDTFSTYSMVAGIWSCMYSLGEVIGPSLGGVLLQYFGFPFTSTVMALTTFTVAISTCIFFICKHLYCNEKYESSDSGISESWATTSTADYEENSPLMMSTIESGYRMYTEEKIQYYEHTRKQESEMGETDPNQLTDVRGTICITHKGACEV